MLGAHPLDSRFRNRRPAMHLRGSGSSLTIPCSFATREAFSPHLGGANLLCRLPMHSHGSGLYLNRRPSLIPQRSSAGSRFRRMTTRSRHCYRRSWKRCGCKPLESNSAALASIQPGSLRASIAANWILLLEG